LDLNLKCNIKKFTSPLYLESGRILEPYQLQYETYGKLNSDKSNVIVVTHALSGNHHAAGRYENDKKSGWWDSLIGSGKSINTDRYFVICVNTIGSCFGSTGPMSSNLPSAEPFRFNFPVITISDMVKAQKILFDNIGIHSVRAIIGGSMGGMQALKFAILYPKFAQNIIVLASTHKTKDWVIAFNKIVSEAIIKDKDFKNGNYDQNVIKKNGLTGLAIGRMAGHISYLSQSSMNDKFQNQYSEDNGLYDLFGKHQVEKYLEYNGYNFSKKFDPLSYLYISKAINIFDISRGYDSLKDALDNIKSNLTLISFSNDMLFFPEEMIEIYDNMSNKNLVEYIDIKSKYGHDAFLVETQKFEKYIEDILK
jgi:homoserine O-acetyltransferase